jgi:hypothetical protein
MSEENTPSQPEDSPAKEVGSNVLLADENKKMRDEMKKFCDTFWNASTGNLDNEVMNFLEDWERKFGS